MAIDRRGGSALPSQTEREEKNLMNKTKLKGTCKTALQLLVTTEDLKTILSCGRVSALKIGQEAKARVDVGRRVLWNVEKIQQYLNKKERIIL